MKVPEFMLKKLPSNLRIIVNADGENLVKTFINQPTEKEIFYLLNSFKKVTIFLKDMNSGEILRQINYK